MTHPSAKGNVALLFSGGLDSSAAAILLAEQYEIILLLTYCNDHGHLFVSASRGAARDLARAFPGRIRHRISSCGSLFESLVTSELMRNYRHYQSRLIWCFGCKLAMHSETIAHCLRERLSAASDGSSSETEYYVEQSPLGLRLIKGLYAEFGIDFVNPVHRIATREEEQRLLRAKGVRLGIAFRKRNPGTQPLCVPGNAIHLLSTLFSIHPQLPEQQVRSFFDDKAPVCKRWIESTLSHTDRQVAL